MEEVICQNVIEVDIMVDTNEDEELNFNLKKKQSELEARLRVAVNELHNEDSVEGFEQREAKRKARQKNKCGSPKKGKTGEKTNKRLF